MNEYTIFEAKLMRLVANEIRCYMEEWGYNQSELARDLCVTHTCINRYLKANRLPSLIVATNLAFIFGVDIDELLLLEVYDNVI